MFQHTTTMGSLLNFIVSFGALLVAFMFPTASRAFAPMAQRSMVVAVLPWQPHPVNRLVVSRLMGSASSTTEGGLRKTVVDICRQKIEQALETDTVEVKGAFDDPNGAHIVISVVSEKFAGKRPVQRQQMVYKALWEELKDPGGIVHAVDAMTCKTPEEANK